MDVATLGTKLLPSKVKVSMKQYNMCKLQQGTPIEKIEPIEFVNIAELLHEYKNKIISYNVENEYITPALSNSDSFIMLLLYSVNNNQPFKANEISSLKKKLSESLKECFKKYGFTRKRSLNIDNMNSEFLANNSDDVYKTEHFTYIAKYFNISFCIVDFDNMERQDFESLDSSKDILMFKKKDGYHLYNGNNVSDKILADLTASNCPLVGSKKVTHIKKLNKLLHSEK